MLVEMAKGIYKLVVPFPFGMREVNCYFIQGDNGFTVVDTGSYCDAAIQLWEKTLSSGILIEKVIVTHVHADHIGLASWLQQRYQVPVMISRKGYEILQANRQKLATYSSDESVPISFIKEHDGPCISEKKRMLTIDANYLVPDELYDNDQQIQMGNQLYDAIWTPGHSSDHFCFYNRQNQIMLIGDHVLDTISPAISIWSTYDGNPLYNYFKSLKLIADYNVKMALSGHGDPILDLRTRIAEIMARHWSRLAQIKQLLRDDNRTAGQLSKMIYRQTSPELFRMMEFTTTLARLVFLESIGEISSRIIDGKIQYRGR